MSMTIHIVDAFTKTPGQGNRAGVMLDADHLTSTQMQDIAAFAGYSETAFVLPSKDHTHDVHVRYFTPTKEVPICGHATIATHFLRAREKNISQKTVIAKTGAGILPVDIEGEGENIRIIMTQAPPEFGHIFDDAQAKRLIMALGITEGDLAKDLPVQVVSTGHSKIMVPMTSIEMLDGLNPDMNILASLSEEVQCNGFFPFVMRKDHGRLETFGRMFAPAIGISEDPVTGNANGPAGAYMEHYGILMCDGFVSYTAHQGIAMGKPGMMEVRLTKEDGESMVVQIAGHAVHAGTREYTAL